MRQNLPASVAFLGSRQYFRSDAEAKQEELRVMVGCVVFHEFTSRFDCTLKAQGTVSRSPTSLNVHNFHVKVRKACSRGIPRNQRCYCVSATAIQGKSYFECRQGRSVLVCSMTLHYFIFIFQIHICKHCKCSLPT